MAKAERTGYPYTTVLGLGGLLLDLENPRLAHPPAGQREGYAGFADEQGAKLLQLCEHIVEHGLNPSQLFVVMPAGEQYVVLDGNRRLAALKALEEPELVNAGLSPASKRSLADIAKGYTPIGELSCVVFRDRSQADPWIELQHSAESTGAGLVPWTAQQKARHRGRAGLKTPALQVLDFVHQASAMSGRTLERFEKAKYPVSTLERVLWTPRVKEILGIHIENGRVKTGFAKPEVLKGLKKVVDDIGTGRIKVVDLERTANRVDYAEGLSDADRPDPSTEASDQVALEQAPDTSSATGRKRRRSDLRHSTKRAHLIPVEFLIQVAPNRIRDIYVELKNRLVVDQVPNATGALLRVFVELSADDFIRRNTIPAPPDARLDKKILAVAHFLESSGAMTFKELRPIRESMKSPDGINLVTNLNMLMHDRNQTVGATDLKAIWDRISTFVAAVWA